MSALTGGPLPRALGARGEPRNLVHFADARLVSLPGSAYVELAKPEIDNDAFGCSFCNKTTTHEHEFNGRIKFEPREER